LSARVRRAVLVVALPLIAAADAGAQDAAAGLLNVDASGVILDGYDPVAFFTDSRPVKGDASIQSSYRGAIYHFASAEHKAAFDAEPATYEPQFGAFCAYAVSLGRTAPIDVSTFSIVNRRLVLQHNERAVKGWSKDVEGNLALADRYWPLVVANGGKQIDVPEKKDPKFVVNVDRKHVALEGYDPIAYWLDNKPTRGTSGFTFDYDGATYQFASAAHRDQFASNPTRYAPAFGGFCAYAVSLGKLRPVDPTIFHFVGGRLLLQHTKKAYDLFVADTDGNYRLAVEKWPGIVAKKGGQPLQYDAPAN
jgi:YHS domain-containing protein